MAQENVIEIDTQKADRLLQKIIILESNNLKTKTNNDQQMVKLIKKMIEEEVQCY